jgi:hypothetical protein
MSESGESSSRFSGASSAASDTSDAQALTALQERACVFVLWRGFGLYWID